jgi:hypothetical protein
MAGIAIHKIKTSRKGSRKDAITAGAQLISTAQNDGRCSGTARARTGDLCARLARADMQLGQVDRADLRAG